MAYNIAALSGAAFNGKLKGFSDYVSDRGSDASRGGFAVLGALQAMKRRGVRMTIERIQPRCG